jgi:hypothetical protein
MFEGFPNISYRSISHCTIEFTIDNRFNRLSLAFDPGLNVISGNSGVGKTTMARALLAVTGRSVAHLASKKEPEVEWLMLFREALLFNRAGTKWPQLSFLVGKRLITPAQFDQAADIASGVLRRVLSGKHPGKEFRVTVTDGVVNVWGLSGASINGCFSAHAERAALCLAVLHSVRLELHEFADAPLILDDIVSGIDEAVSAGLWHWLSTWRHQTILFEHRHTAGRLGEPVKYVVSRDVAGAVILQRPA